jgi:hypothetical protein
MHILMDGPELSWINEHVAKKSRLVNILQHSQRINPSFPRCTEGSKHHLLLLGGILPSDSVTMPADGETARGAACLFVVPVLFATLAGSNTAKTRWRN